MAKQRSRGRNNPDNTKQPIRLCDDDQRKLYGLLDADVNVRLRRIEIAVAVLTVSTLSPKLGGPSPSQVVGLIHSTLGGLFS